MATLALPTSEIVGQAWLRLVLPPVLPGVRVDSELPDQADDALRNPGFVRTQPVGGDVERDVPMRHPVVQAECWVAPPADKPDLVPWRRANQLAERVVEATFDRQFMGLVLDLQQLGFGQYQPAQLHTVIALGDPGRVEDPSNWGRFDVDLLINWTA